MATQLSVAVRNAMLDAFETAIGASPTLVLRTGAPPANCAAADSGTALATLPLPADFMAAAANGSKALLGSWTDAVDTAGTAGHFRIYTSGGACAVQGTVATSGSDHLNLDDVTLTVGQVVTITGFTLSQPNG